MTDPSRSPDTGDSTGVAPSRTSATVASSYPGTPRWVIVGGIVVLVLVLVFVGAHLAGGSAGGHMPPMGGH